MEEDIKCPKCNWAPDGGAYWKCSCGHVWNTFATAGKCPACGIVWTFTQCPSSRRLGGCSKISPHIDWYRSLDKLLQKELETIFRVVPSVPE